MHRIQRYWYYFALLLVFALITVLAMLYLPILTGYAVDQIIGPENVNFTQLFVYLKKMGYTLLLSAIAQWFMNLSNNRLTYFIVRDVRNESIQKIETLPLSYLDAHPTGEILSKVIADVRSEERRVGKEC